MKSLVAITGSSGFIGSALVPFLESKGYTVLKLVRRQPKSHHEVFWNPDRDEIDKSRLQGISVFIHLAGENIADHRWTDEVTKRLISSRIRSTTLLAKALASLLPAPTLFISASAIGYYGVRGEEFVDESSPRGEGFLAQLSEEWETATHDATKAGIRVVNPRFGAVLDPSGGAMKKMLLPFRLGVGGKLGSGTQYFSWIALADVVTAIEHCIRNTTLSGAVNFVAPNAVTNREFTETLAKVLHRPAVFTIPGFVLRLMFGQLADEVLLGGAHVVPKKLTESGFQFRFETLEPALKSFF